MTRFLPPHNEVGRFSQQSTTFSALISAAGATVRALGRFS
jgi:hypothetical protein